MKHVKSIVLAFAFLVGIVAGLAYAPKTEAASGCFHVDCNICCYLPGGHVVCTERACPA